MVLPEVTGDILPGGFHEDELFKILSKCITSPALLLTAVQC